jgi:hypothetical protein
MRKLLPPGGKPHYRFVVAIIGIIGLAFLTMAAVALIYPEGGSSASTDPSANAAGPGAPVGDPGAQTRPPDRPPAAPGGPAAANGQLTAAYRVLPDGVWDAGFQAEVEISNGTGKAQKWRVTLRYPRTVMGLMSSWMDGYPEPTVKLAGDEVRFTGTLAVPPRQTARLRFQFAKQRQGPYAPLECTINDRPCALPG